MPQSAQGLRILLVDDHDDTRNSLRQLLAKRGYRMTVAGSCREAIELAGLQPFDLVVSDLGLPDGTGHELMKTLQTEHKLTGIALSGYGMASDLERSRAAGFAIHLTKPVNIKTLETAIAELIHSPPVG